LGSITTKNITLRVKLDILKLKNVTEIDEMISIINELYDVNMDEDDIPEDDEKTWNLVCNGDTKGIFQMASNVAIPVIKKIQPRSIEELSAVNAFIRPGSSGLEEYLEGKKDPSEIRKLDPKIDEYLEPTYGAIVYQEQIMQLISELMGISFGEADLYRRALEDADEPKNRKIVDDFNNNVVENAVEQGFDREVAELVRRLIIENSGYGFNKSHSVAYTKISYQTAYLKANYPLVFYTAMFNGNIDSIDTFIKEAKDKGITVKPPHVNKSNFKSTIEDKENNIIRLGLNAVKGFGPKAVESIMNTQPYESMDDFLDRNNLRSVNKGVIEAGLNVNAFKGIGIEIDEDDIPQSLKQFFEFENKDDKTLLHLNRSQKKKWFAKYNELKNAGPIPNYFIPTSMIKGKYLQRDDLRIEEDKGFDSAIVIPENKLDKFGLLLDDVKDFRTRKRPKDGLKANKKKRKMPKYRRALIKYCKEISQANENDLQAYLKEKEIIGYSFKKHPLEAHMDKIMPYDSISDGEILQTAGIISEVQQRTSRNGNPYYWVILQTPEEKVRVTIWSNQYNKYEDTFTKNNIIAVRGKKGYGGMNMDKLKVIKKNN
jgi:DNA polymerase III alpha subunit